MRDTKKRTWAPPTRRAFVGMLGAAVAAIAIRKTVTITDEAPVEPPRDPWAGKTRWIGHC